MKAYTSLEQSKKLTEILPLESADMYYFTIIRNYPYSQGKIKTIAKIMDCSFSSNYDTHCWSLAALLDVLPTYLFEFDRGIDLNVYPNLNGRGWHCSYMPNCIENMKTDKFKLITSEDNIGRQ